MTVGTCFWSVGSAANLQEGQPAIEALGGSTAMPDKGRLRFSARINDLA